MFFICGFTAFSLATTVRSSQRGCSWLPQLPWSLSFCLPKGLFNSVLHSLPPCLLTWLLKWCSQLEGDSLRTEWFPCPLRTSLPSYFSNMFSGDPHGIFFFLSSFCPEGAESCSAFSTSLMCLHDRGCTACFSQSPQPLWGSHLPPTLLEQGWSPSAAVSGDRIPQKQGRVLEKWDTLENPVQVFLITEIQSTLIFTEPLWGWFQKFPLAQD